jgi:hypothetical protein
MSRQSERDSRILPEARGVRAQAQGLPEAQHSTRRGQECWQAVPGSEDSHGTEHVDRRHSQTRVPREKEVGPDPAYIPGSWRAGVVPVGEHKKGPGKGGEGAGRRGGAGREEGGRGEGGRGGRRGEEEEGWVEREEGGLLRAM